MENISISLSEGGHKKDVSEVRVDGVIDTLTATELEQVIDSLLRRERFRVVVDLAGVDYISSAGWGIFISHIKDVRANDGDIKLANMVPDVYEIFELLEFDKVLKVYQSLDEAVEAFDSAPAASGQKKTTRKHNGR
ncbi:anti-sigma factor antagonist [candidate division GN15 bacterium]|nr:anti-sigma factor antagonist [candidate division GN15 bacterium]